jgi:hypothetical protein
MLGIKLLKTGESNRMCAVVVELYEAEVEG